MNCKQLSIAELFKAGKENSAASGGLCNGDSEGRAGSAGEGRLTCIACWTPSHSPARRTQMASPSCALAHGSWGCRRWGRLCRSPPGYRQRCTLLGESSGGCAGCLLCCRCGDSPQRCTGTALPGRERTPQQQGKRVAQALATLPEFGSQEMWMTQKHRIASNNKVGLSSCWPNHTWTKNEE